MDHLMIAEKLVFVGPEGASIMKRKWNNIYVRPKLLTSPYMLNINCIAHMMNLAFKIVSKFPSISKVEDLVHETHGYFSRSPK